MKKLQYFVTIIRKNENHRIRRRKKKKQQQQQQTKDTGPYRIIGAGDGYSGLRRRDQIVPKPNGSGDENKPGNP